MKRKALKIIIILISIILIGVLLFVGIRYVRYKDLIGEYTLVEGTSSEMNLKLNLFSWHTGKKENLECDLWGCKGYDEGPIYYLKDDRIYFRYDKHNVYSTKVEIKKDKKNLYIIYKDKNNKVKEKYKRK